MLALTLPFVLTAQQSGVPKPLGSFLSLAGISRFQLQDESHHSKDSFSLANQSTGSPIARLSVIVTPVTAPEFDCRHAFDVSKGKPNASGLILHPVRVDWRKPHRTPTGSPLGFDLYFSSGADSVRASASSKYGTVTAFIQSRGAVKSRNVVWAGGKAERDQLAERLVRWTLAQMVGGSLTTAPTRSVNGIKVRRFGEQSGGSYLVANDWAASQKVRPTIDLTEGRFTVPTVEGELTLILGSDRAKLNGKWLPMDEVLPARGTDILLPESLAKKLEK